MKNILYLNYICIAILLCIVIGGCTKSTTTNATTSSYVGSDYFPVNVSSVESFHIVGIQTMYDTLGNVTSRDSYDNSAFGTMGAAIILNQQSVYPVYTDNGHGTIKNSVVCYLGSSTDGIFGINRDGRSADYTILPKDLSDGTSWFIAPPNYQATILQHLGQYTNAEGKTYSDVIKVSVSVTDTSTYYYNSNFATYHGEIGTAEAYLAKGVGIVSAQLISYSKETYSKYYGAYFAYQKSTCTGTGNRK